MKDSSIHVVPCTPQLSCLHSTPLSAVSSYRFYNSVSPRTPSSIFRRGGRTAETNQRLASSDDTPSTSSLTPIMRVNRRQLVSFPIGTTPVQLRPSFTPIWRLEKGRSKANISASQNQVVPGTPQNITENKFNSSKTKIKPRGFKLNSHSRGAPYSTLPNSHSRPYFTADDDIFLDETEDGVHGDESEHIFDL